MLALIPDLFGRKLTHIALLICAATALASCTKDQPPLIADPAGTRETALPWNEQQKWEREGEAGALIQGRR
ncbi:MAG: hypothetical protein QOG51_328 [Verrucomicrobiota bacterium]|jgi:hypothetical protein